MVIVWAYGLRAIYHMVILSYHEIKYVCSLKVQNGPSDGGQQIKGIFQNWRPVLDMNLYMHRSELGSNLKRSSASIPSGTLTPNSPVTPVPLCPSLTPLRFGNCSSRDGIVSVEAAKPWRGGVDNCLYEVAVSLSVTG